MRVFTPTSGEADKECLVAGGWRLVSPTVSYYRLALKVSLHVVLSPSTGTRYPFFQERNIIRFACRHRYADRKCSQSASRERASLHVFRNRNSKREP